MRFKVCAPCALTINYCLCHGKLYIQARLAIKLYIHMQLHMYIHPVRILQPPINSFVCYHFAYQLLELWLIDQTYHIDIIFGGHLE